MTHRILLLAFLPLSACSAPRFEVTPEYGYTKLSGDFAVSSGSITGTTSMGDLGLDDREGQPGARVDLKWGSPHLSLALHESSTSGSGTTAVDLTHGGVTINSGANTDSKLDLGYGNAIVTFDFVPGDTIELGLGLGAQVASVDARVTETGTANTIRTNESVPVPVLAARAAVELGPVTLDALLSGISLDYNGDSLNFYDIDLRARWRIFQHGHALIGWHRWTVDLDYQDGSDNVKLDVTSEGPYFGIVFSF